MPHLKKIKWHLAEEGSLLYGGMPRRWKIENLSKIKKLW